MPLITHFKKDAFLYGYSIDRHIHDNNIILDLRLGEGNTRINFNFSINLIDYSLILPTLFLQSSIKVFILDKISVLIPNKIEFKGRIND